MWRSLFDKEWEVDTESDRESDGSIERKPKNRIVGVIIQAKNQQGPNHHQSGLGTSQVPTISAALYWQKLATFTPQSLGR
jgi:hypothetical protein